MCLIHTGKLSFFEELKAMALDCLDGRSIDYIVFSHFEADECGSVNEWLKNFPNAEVYCNKIANINLGDFLSRPANVMKDDEVLSLGNRKLRLVETPHFPHNWDAHLWFEETEKYCLAQIFVVMVVLQSLLRQGIYQNKSFHFMSQVDSYPMVSRL